MSRIIVVPAIAGAPPPPPPPVSGSLATRWWQFRLWDAATAEPIGELTNADPRRLRFALNGRPSYQFTIPATNRFADVVRRGDKTLVTAHEKSTGTKIVRLCGPIVQAQKAYNADGSGTIACTVLGGRVRLAGRRIGKTPVGFVRGDRAAGIPVDRGSIAVDVLNEANASGDTGIRLGTVEASVDDYGGPWRYQKAEDKIAELAAPLDGFDWTVVPIAPQVDSQGIAIGRMDIVAHRGIERPNCVWEFGDGKHNVESWTDLTDATTLCNSAYMLSPNWEQDPVAIDQVEPVAHYQDDIQIADRGLYEDLIEDQQPSPSLRNLLVAKHVQVRSTPKRVISFQPINEDMGAPDARRRVPRLWLDYDIGDEVRFRAVEYFEHFDATGKLVGYRKETTIDAIMRVYAVVLDLSKEGVVKPSPVLVQEGDQ